MTSPDPDAEKFQPDANDIALVIACDEGDLSRVKYLVEEMKADVCYQDFETGISVLMVAASSGHSEVASFLLSEGAPWNAVDRQYMCAGDYAAKHGHQKCVDLLMDHAVTSELILSLTHQSANEDNPTAAGDSIVFNNHKKDNDTSSSSSSYQKSLNASYLSSRLSYSDDGHRLVDTSTQLAVMMNWEQPLMAKHAAWICHSDRFLNDPLRVLNVGFGMGIVDKEIQSYKPHEHVIIEAHPEVLQKMEQDGWSSDKGVRVIPTRWQDAVSVLVEEILKEDCPPFDGIFFDTYAEDDHDLREFHTWLPKLLRHPSTDSSTNNAGRYSFYNGVCPDNVFFHGVACETIRVHLKRLNVDCDFEPIPVDVSDANLWNGLSQRYWHFDHYFLPKCVYINK